MRRCIRKRLSRGCVGFILVMRIQASFDGEVASENVAEVNTRNCGELSPLTCLTNRSCGVHRELFCGTIPSKSKIRGATAIIYAALSQHIDRISGWLR